MNNIRACTKYQIYNMFLYCFQLSSLVQIIFIDWLISMEVQIYCRSCKDMTDRLVMEQMRIQEIKNIFSGMAANGIVNKNRIISRRRNQFWYRGTKKKYLTISMKRDIRAVLIIEIKTFINDDRRMSLHTIQIL